MYESKDLMELTCVYNQLLPFNRAIALSLSLAVEPLVKGSQETSGTILNPGLLGTVVYVVHCTRHPGEGASG